MAVLAPVAKQQFFDANGDPLASGKLYTYAPGGTTPKATYLDAAKAASNANPIVLDSRGEAIIYLDGATKFVLKTAADATIWTRDPVEDFGGGSGASQIGFIQAGTGAVSTTVQAKLREWVSVKDFGAVGDGTADDTAEIQAAIDAVGAAGGGIVFFPEGTYLISGTLTVAYSGVVLHGSGTTASVLQFTNLALDSIYLEGPSAPGIYNCQITTLTLEHSGKTGGAAIRMYRANQCQVSRVNINNCWNGLDLKTINNVIISETVITQVKGAYGCKFYSLATGAERSDVLTMRDTVINCNDNGGDGIVWDGLAHTMRLFGFGILGTDVGLLIQNTAGSASNYPAFGEFHDLEIDGTNGTAVQMEAGTQMTFAGCDLFNLSTATGPVLSISEDGSGSRTNSIRMTACRIGGGAEEAIKCAGRDVVITGCHIGGGVGTTYPAIAIDTNCQDFLIVGNQIGRYWGSSIDKYTYGVVIAATTYRGIVSENSFYGCLNEVSNSSSTGTVVVGENLNRAGVPVFPAAVVRKSLNNTSVFRETITNASSGANVTADVELSTGTTNSFIISSLKDNSATPYFQQSVGSAVTAGYWDFPIHSFRNLAGTVMFRIGQALAEYADDAAAATGGLPVGGYYRTASVIKQRVA